MKKNVIYLILLLIGLGTGCERPEKINPQIPNNSSKNIRKGFVDNEVEIYGKELGFKVRRISKNENIENILNFKNNGEAKKYLNALKNNNQKELEKIFRENFKEEIEKYQNDLIIYKKSGAKISEICQSWGASHYGSKPLSFLHQVNFGINISDGVASVASYMSGTKFFGPRFSQHWFSQHRSSNGDLVINVYGDLDSHVNIGNDISLHSYPTIFRILITCSGLKTIDQIYQ